MATKDDTGKLWMSAALRDSHKGALRAAAKRRGLLKGGDDTLSMRDLAQLETDARKKGDTQLLRRVVMARNMMKAKH
jgi:hypothetical protein